MAHRNLHHLGGGPEEVSTSIRADYKRDEKWVHISDLVIAVGLYWLVRNWEVPDGAALFAVVFGGMTGLRVFIDQSNRNWWLHRVNYDAEVQRERRLGQDGGEETYR